MTRIVFLLVGFVFSLWGRAQEDTNPTQQHVTLKWAPTGLVLGNAALQGEYNFGGRNSLTAKIGLPVNVKHSLSYENSHVGFNMKAMSFLAGYRTYFSKKHLQGLYYEPYFKYAYQTAEGTGKSALGYRPAIFSFTNNYSAAGIGLQLGAQFLIAKRLVFDLFIIGPEINSATNTFKATEISDTFTWNNEDSYQAKKDIKEFLDQFPFIRNRTNIMVDPENKRVTAVFKGALPGVRTGFSIGFAF